MILMEVDAGFRSSRLNGRDDLTSESHRSVNTFLGYTRKVVSQVNIWFKHIAM